MNRLSASILFRYWAGATVAYFVASLMLPGQFLIAVSKLVLIIISLVVALTWGPGGLRELREGRVQGPTVLYVGISGFAIYNTVYQVVTLASRALGQPDYIVNTAPIGYLIAGMAGFAMLFLISPEIQADGSPERARLWWFVVAIIAAGALGYLFGANGV